MGRRRKDAPPIPDDDPRTPLQRNCANARERDRMRVLSKGFSKLKTTLPWVPPDTKLSKLDTLRLATCYIAHLRQILAEDEQNHEDIISGPEHFTQLNSDVIDDFTYMDNTKQEYITQFPDNNYVTSQQVNGYSPKIMDGLSGRYAHPMNLTWPYNIAGGRHNGNTASTDSPVTSRSRLDAASNCATQET